MKLVRFTVRSGEPAPVFGAMVGDRVAGFAPLAEASGLEGTLLADSSDYLRNLPASEAQARTIVDWAEANAGTLADSILLPLQSVTLHTPVEVASLFDFGLTPRHLASSVRTWRCYEDGNPETEALIRIFEERVKRPRTPPAGQLERLPHYKCNMNSIVGDGVDIPWPSYTEYLDVEPELAVVYGNNKQPVAGYCIFNDVSARDVQPPELGKGFFLAKDMACGNQLGPCLVTSDELANPFDLPVTVWVNGQQRFTGTTAEISRDARAVIATLDSVAPLLPGSVMGFGTIPDCTGLDNGDFLAPGDRVEITIDRIGTLRCRLLPPASGVEPSRWAARPELDPYR
ncbi:fumarylacetoacetate hydrolase family protein [Pseudohaliea sp.]|uniref:fumarylacetoacetate hydrolase family protein n=1 Tax=Pseudohaliea sp. TaxID=2740289 RepID=UPI0032EBCBE8